MHEALSNEQKRNDADCTYPLSWLFHVSSLNVGTPLYGINNGDLEILIRVGYMVLTLIFNTPNKFICRLPQRCRLNIVCASLGLSRQFCAKGPRCICPQNIGRACSMPVSQIQAFCPSLFTNGKNRFNAVLCRYTPEITIYECRYIRRCTRARAWETTNTQLKTYCCLPENDVYGSCRRRCFE